MVYTGDLKSPARIGLVGSSPTAGTTKVYVKNIRNNNIQKRMIK